MESGVGMMGMCLSDGADVCEWLDDGGDGVDPCGLMCTYGLDSDIFVCLAYA
jgi:hypothetical protein